MMRSIFLVLALAGCAATGSDVTAREENALATELAGRVEGRPDNCLPAVQGQSLRIIDRRTIGYDRGPTLWVNRLAQDCPGLRPLSTLIVESHGGQYCRGDHVRGLEQGAIIPGPVCILGDFVPYRRVAAR